LKKILITGGDGFLARSIAEKLARKYLIERCNRSVLDLNDSSAVFEFLKQGSFDVVIHTATYDAAPKNSLKDSGLVLENNLNMFFNLARCKDLYGKMLYFGSGAEFSRDHWVSHMSESYFDKYVPKDQYGFSKYVMAKYAATTNNIFNLRLFGVYGKYDDWRYRFISNICCHVIFDIPVKVYNNSCVDFLFIDDLVRIVQWFIGNTPKYQVYNVCSGVSYRYYELAKEIISYSGKDMEIEVINHVGSEYTGNNSLLLSEIGEFEFSMMNETLNMMYAWLNKHSNKIDINEFHY